MKHVLCAFKAVQTETEALMVVHKKTNAQETAWSFQTGQSAEARAHAEHIQLLLSHSIYVLLGNLAASCTLAIGAWEHNPHSWLLVWLGTVVLFNTLRWAFGYRFPSGTPNEQNLRSWDLRIMLSVLSSGVIWGYAGVLFFLPGESGHNFFLAVLIVGMAAAAAAALSYHRWAYPAFFLPAVMPITIALALEDGVAEQALALVTPFYFFLMYLLSRNIYKAAHESILARFRHERLAFYDHLTGVANRRAFEETLDKEWRRALRSRHPLSLIIADIDDFKRYNDTYGHATGDKVLQAIARMIEESIRRGADLAARIGGEEFGVILPETHLAGAQILAEQIRVHCHQADTTRSYEAPRLSLGVSACMPDESHSVEDLFAQADKALYAAKQGGKDRVVSLPIT